MALELLQMYAAGSGGTEESIASLDIPEDGVITGIKWAADADLDADDDTFAAEVSFLAGNTLNSNDARGMIDSIRHNNQLVSSGMSGSAINQFTTFSPGLRVAGGERVYLHITTTASTISRVLCIIHLDTDRGTTPRRSRRRR